MPSCLAASEKLPACTTLTKTRISLRSIQRLSRSPKNNSRFSRLIINGRRAYSRTINGGIPMKKLLFIQRDHGRHWVGDGFPVRSVFSYNDIATEKSPILLMDYAGPAHFPPSQHRRGVGEHPHRGFETVTIVYSGEVGRRGAAGGGGRGGPGGGRGGAAAAGGGRRGEHG